MKNNIFNLFLILTLLTSASCGKVVKSISKSIADTAVGSIGEIVSCMITSPLTALANSISIDTGIGLTEETFDQVSSDIRNKENITKDNFWNMLSPESKQTLIYELNLLILKKKFEDASSIYKVTAHFFLNFKKISFNKDATYYLKSTESTLYSFKLYGKKRPILILIDSNCQDEAVDLSKTSVPVDRFTIDKIKLAYECYSNDDRFILMEGENSLLVEINRRFYQDESFKKIIKENSKKEILKYSSRDIELKLTLSKKNREIVLDGHSGIETKIELKLPHTDIDANGTCREIIKQ